MNVCSVNDGTIDDLHWLVFASGELLDGVSHGRDQLADHQVVQVKIRPLLTWLVQLLTEHQPDQPWEGFNQRYGDDKRVYGGLFKPARSLTV